MKTLKDVLAFLWNARTTAFGYICVILGVLAIQDSLFSPEAAKWIVLGNGLLTACLGHYNNLRVRQAARKQDEGKVALD